MTDDHDLRLVASFRDDIDAPSPQRLASMRAEFLKGRTVTRKTFFTPKRLGLIGGPVVAALAIGAFALIAPGDPAAPVPTVTSAQDGPAPDVQEPLAPNADARTVLAYFATKAANGEAATLKQGQFILETRTGSSRSVKTGAASESTSEVWHDPFAGMQAAKYLETENGKVEDRSSPLEPRTAGLQSPTPEYLAALPDDADAIVAKWREEWYAINQWDWKAGAKGTDEPARRLAPGTPEYAAAEEEADEELFRSLDYILYLSREAATPAKRTLIWEALGKLKGVTRVEGTVKDFAGREGIALTTLNDRTGYRWETIFDPATGQILGFRATDDKGVVFAWNSVETKVVDSLGEK